MTLTLIDLAIVFGYIVATIAIGFWASRNSTKNVDQYFLGGRTMPWYALGLSNASGMFDIGGTMWMVALLFIYGLKSIFIPWLWPVFNQIVLMVFLSAWLRRSGVTTGAEWITYRFGRDRGSHLASLVVVLFAVMAVLGFLAFSFVGIGKFAAAFIPFSFADNPARNETIYGLIFVVLTGMYVVKGGMVSVVFTEVMQFIVMGIASIAIGAIAMNALAPGAIETLTPEGWLSPWPEWRISLDWADRLPAATTRIEDDGYSLFLLFTGIVFFKGVLSSLAGPTPNYDMQRVLATRNAREASLMSGVVNVVLLFPRYMLITGLTVLGLLYYTDDIANGGAANFEQILPLVIANDLPVGLVGLVVAGLLAAFMSSFAATTNAAPVYIVNDVIKRYLQPNKDPKYYAKLSVLFSAVFIVVGTLLGLTIPTLNGIIVWITGALGGGYVAANVLKWVWWRFNGYGYFWGMLSGIVIAVPFIFIELSPIYAFPIILVACLIGSVAGTLLSPPQDMNTLKHFYVTTRPWGFWGPVHRAALEDNPDLGKNTDFVRDWMNVLVGICWQTSLTATPIFFVLKQWRYCAISATIIAITAIFLKFSWYDRIRNEASDYDKS